MGVQSPRLRLEPRASVSDADDAAFLSTRYGLEPDDWQFLVLKAWLGVRPDGQWAARRCGLSVPRQNGKNAIIEMRELFGMVVLGEKFLHTAHEVKTARKAFIRLSGFFENPNFPELAALVTDVRKTNGQEAIVLTNGGSCEFVARSKGSARGFTADVLVIDEAEDLGEEDIEALLPTISAAPLANPQQIFTGTPPGPKVEGEIFSRIRSDGLLGRDKALAWHEWSCPADADLDDVNSLAIANPGLGVRLQKDVTDAERRTLSDAGYGRERLGMWSEASSARVIDSMTWGLCADEKSRPATAFALAVDVSPDRSVASVAFAGEREDGLMHVELDEHRNGVGWVAAYVAERCERNDIRAVVIDGSSPAASVLEDLKKRRIRVTVTQARDVAQSFGEFYDAVQECSVRHTDQPQVNASLAVARKRDLAGGSAWSRKNATSDITPIVACTLALWGAKSSRVKRPGGGRVAGERKPTGNRVGSML